MISQEPQRIHDASLQILEEIGVRLEHDGVIDRVIKAGARPGPKPQCVRFPRKMVDEYLAIAPSAVTLDDRQGLGNTLTANSRSIFWTNPGLNIHSGDGVREVESLCQLVIDDEMVAYARHFERGVTVSDETIDFDLIQEVGIAGSYLETDETLYNYRKHLWIPGLLNRKTREGCHQTLGERAESRAREILDADKEPKIGVDELKELKKIEAKFKKQING